MSSELAPKYLAFFRYCQTLIQVMTAVDNELQKS